MEVRKVTNESKKPITTDNHIIALSMVSHFTSQIPRPPLFGHLPPPPCSPSSSTSQPHHPLFPSDHYLLPLKPILILRECFLLIFLFHPTVGRGLCLAEQALGSTKRERPSCAPTHLQAMQRALVPALAV